MIEKELEQKISTYVYYEFIQSGEKNFENFY